MLAVLCLSFWASAVFGQRLKKFTPDRETYPSQVREFLKDSDADKDEELEPLLLDFTTVWTSGGISDKEAEEVYKISNNFLKKRINEYEQWNWFLRSLIHIESNEEEKLLLPWLEDLEKLSGDNIARATSDYLRTSYQMFYHYTMYDDGRIVWRLASGDYNFGFDGEPVFTFDGADIWGKYKGDSTRIEGTAGSFYPRRYTIEGNGGYVYFVRAGLSEDSAFAELSNYTINVTKTDFEADSVKLTTLLFLKEPTLGFFEEKLTSVGGRGGGTFPRFTSYDQHIAIKDIVPGADFEGGFAVIGSKFYGGGTDSSKARFSFSYKDQKIITTEADRFLLRPDKIESEQVSLIVKLKEDSIYHPKVTMRYLAENGQLNIIREDEGLEQTPFSNSYHKMDMAFEVLTWNNGDPQMKLGNLNLGTETPVVFESKNYYRGNRFDQLRGMNDRSPLYLLRDMVDTYGKRTFSNDEVARFLRMDPRNAHRFMMQMSVFGFVQYDLDTQTGTVKDKVFNYISNYEKKRDYDVIQFVSNLTQGNNATISLEDYDMEIIGINTIALSDSQKVRLFPRENKIVVHQGLNFDFDGKVVAGRFSYWGELFEFNYNDFRINMENVDSMRFKVESFQEPRFGGPRELVDVKTVLQELTGELLIDEPNNKSGQQSYDQYPIFRSAKDSYIYYDKKNIFNGVYNREEFFVRLEPFEIDSLDNITTQGLKFEGTFTSAGIFPDLQQTIKVQPDYSLGFTTETPPAGLAAYGGKGTFTSKLSLSNKGLRGDGRIDYLNSVANSPEFFFFPDSTNGIAENYEITAQMTGPETPHALGQGVFLHWEPKNDVLYTTSRETPFAMYDEVGMTATGTLAHSPNALKGKGLLEFFDAETRSQDYLFKNREFSSNQLAFRVRANPTAEWGFGMENAKGRVNFDQEKGQFTLNDPADYFSFPANKYICYMDYAEWQIPQKAIDVQKRGGEASSEMVSVHPRQDSLRFQAGYTKFYLESSLLKSFKVPEIKVADASIFPDTGYVEIEQNAKMRTLTNAAITANRTTEFHKFYGGTVDITSRRRYTASADYEYLDQDGTPWPIHFETIKVDTSETTIGRAIVKQEDGFYMSPYFAYYGQVGLQADRKALAFKGSTHIESDCEAVTTDWFAFESIVDPDNIIIDLPYVDPNDKTKNLNNGVFLASDTISGYAAFLSKRVSAADKEMFFANGKLYYEESIGAYVIVNAEKLDDPSAPGNYLTFNNTACEMHGEGSMSIGEDASQMNINSWGNIDYNLETDDMVLDLVLGLDFFFSDDVLKQMAGIMNKVTLLEGTDLNRKAFQVSADELLKPKDKKKFFDAIANYGAPEEFPDEYEKTVLLTDITLEWVPEAISFLSSGDIGVGALGKYPVNKKMKGLMEIQRKRRGDEVYLYLEVDRSTYFYFEYKRNQLVFFTSEEPLMDLIKELDLKKRRNEVKGKPPFTYTIGTRGKMNRFLSRFEKFE